VPEKWQWYRTLLSYKWPQGDGVWLIPVLFLVPSIVTGADPVTLARASIQGSVGTTVGNHHQPGWESVWIIKEEFQDFSLDAGGKSTVLVSEALNSPPPLGPWEPSSLSPPCSCKLTLFTLDSVTYLTFVWIGCSPHNLTSTEWWCPILCDGEIS
jgi:hypothetical protein